MSANSALRDRNLESESSDINVFKLDKPLEGAGLHEEIILFSANPGREAT